jgi:hypothetical protein
MLADLPPLQHHRLDTRATRCASTAGVSVSAGVRALLLLAAILLRADEVVR